MFSNATKIYLGHLKNIERNLCKKNPEIEDISASVHIYNPQDIGESRIPRRRFLHELRISLILVCIGSPAPLDPPMQAKGTHHK